MPLLVAHVAPFPQYATRTVGIPLPRDYADVKAEGAELINELLEEVAGGAPDGLRLMSMSLVGEPGEALVRLARDGDILVVGQGARKLVSRLLAPSTQQYCMRNARTTVVCVRPPVAGALTPSLTDEAEVRSTPRRLWGLRRQRPAGRDS
jgi:nucleotide-binding universal stress UspA family protein